MLLRMALLAATGMVAISGSASAATPMIWESNFGTPVTSGDDTGAMANFGFAFPFLGSSYTDAFVSTNGNIQFQSSSASTGTNPTYFLAGGATIAPQWFDMVGTALVNTSVANRVVFTWNANEYSGGGNYMTQAQLFSDGRIVFGFAGPIVPWRHNTLTGVTGGHGAPDNAVDFRSSASAPGGTAYAYYPANAFNLNGRNVTFTPSGNGFAINAVGGVPEPASWAMLISGMTLVGGAMRRRRGVAAIA